MRNTKQLLQLMLDNEQLFSTGMCGWIRRMYFKDVITEKEFYILRVYILNNVPFKSRLYRFCRAVFDCHTLSYWYPPGWLWPRRRWIKQHIKLLSQQGM